MNSILIRITLIVFLILSIPTLTLANVKTFIKEYTYQASEVDSKVSSRSIALEQVKRILLEELGTYLESHTEIVNFQLRKDQITALTAGVVQTQILKEKWDGERYWMEAKIEADPDEVVKAVHSLHKDRDKSKELEDANKRAEVALREVERLRKELELAKKDETKIARYDQAINELSAVDWFRKGLSMSREGNYKEAVAANTKAIHLNPKYALAYVNRAFAHSKIGNYRQVLEDSNRAIELDPHNALGYVNRAFAYSTMGNYQRVLEDSNRAIELDPTNALAYVNRGLAYSTMGNYRKVLEDSNKAIELDPHNALGYVNRSFANIKLGNYQGAIQDATRALELDPGNALCYANRGDAHYNLGNYEKAISDYKAGARMGQEGCQRMLRSMGISW